MTKPAQRPLLFLDVDGTLLPTGGAQLPSTLEQWGQWQHPSNPQLAKLVPAHGPRLLAMHDANEVIAPLLGLPELPVAGLPDAPEEDEAGVLHWKTRTLVETAAGRPFVSDLDRAWVEAQHQGQALLHRVDSAIGLTVTDLAALDEWLQDVSGAS
ncbi:hypothetical protein ACWD62_32125 [Streptomyces sp. NPDC005146]